MCGGFKEKANEERTGTVVRDRVPRDKEKVVWRAGFEEQELERRDRRLRIQQPRHAMTSETLARGFVVAGLVLVGIGAIIWVVGRVVDLGNLPGDIAYRSETVRVYVPITTMIIASIVLTVLLNLLLRWWQ